MSGLTGQPKSLPCKYLYDERGSQLFEQICELEEYYPTRTELSIMRSYGEEIAKSLGPDCVLVEYGSGSSRKTRILLDHLDDVNAYVPVDISRELLESTALSLDRNYPTLSILPVCADFTEEFSLPDFVETDARKVAYFPGSTIGNFTAEEAIDLLRRIAALCGPGGGLLIGVDLHKDVSILEAAYDDDEGVTREFNQNVLHRINRELDADFDLDQFEHLARHNPEHSRIEMHLVSNCDQTVRVAETEIEFRVGESIHTENSHKYTRRNFTNMATTAGFSVEAVWTDEREYFSVQYLVADG